MSKHKKSKKDLTEKETQALQQEQSLDMEEDTQPEGDDAGDNEEQQQKSIERQTNQIIETGSVTTSKGKHLIHCLTIVGQVEGHYTLPAQNKTTKYEHVIPQLVAIEEVM